MTPPFVLAVLTALFALSELAVLFALAWRFKSTMVVVLFGVLRSVLAMVGVVARVVNLQATNQLNIDTKNLEVSSVQNKHKAKTRSRGLLAGAGAGISGDAAAQIT
jgi:hypothetical protein